METIRQDHLSESEVEDYARGRISRQSATNLIGHLLNCDLCAALVEQEQNFRDALLLAAKQQPQDENSFSRRISSTFKTFSIPALGVAAALALAMLYVPLREDSGAGQQTVALKAYRNEASQAVPQHDSLILKLDGAGLTFSTLPEVRIVNSGGRQVWQGKPIGEQTVWIARVEEPLAAGTYWVRLGDAGKSAYLREFRLDIR